MDDKTLTVLEAAQLTGKARSTITRSIKAGDLPNSQQKDDGSYTVQLYDLIQTGLIDQVRASKNAHENELEKLKQDNQKLKIELEHTHKIIEDQKERISELKDIIETLKNVHQLVSKNTEAFQTLSEQMESKAINSPLSKESDEPQRPSASSEQPPTPTSFFGRLFGSR